MGVYVELHVEQGRALDLVDKPVAVASAIWPHGRWLFRFCGEANHAGATRLVDRRDPMLTFATSVHDARTRAGRPRRRRDIRQGAGHPQRRQRHSVGGRGLAGCPRRRRGHSGAHSSRQITADAARNADADRTSVTVETESVSPAVLFPDEPRARIQRALADEFGEVPVLPTAAGHDAGILSAKVPTAMLFVRNPTGVSHSPDEYAEIADCRQGARALATVMEDWVS